VGHHFAHPEKLHLNGMLVAAAMFGYVLVKVLNKATNSLEKGSGNRFRAGFAKRAKAAS
jgi:hypothetical protein